MAIIFQLALYSLLDELNDLLKIENQIMIFR